MKTKITRNLWMAAVIGAALIAGGLLFAGSAGQARAQCSMPGMTHGTTMDHQNHGDQADNSAVTHLVMSGRIDKIDKAKRTVTLTVEVPVDRKVKWEQVQTLKVGDTVKTQLVSDKSGTLLATSVTPDKSIKGQSSVKTAELTITGIMCAACSERLQKSLNKTPGVVSAKVDTAEATISYDSTQIDLEGLKEAVRQTEPIHAGHPFGVK